MSSFPLHRTVLPWTITRGRRPKACCCADTSLTPLHPVRWQALKIKVIIKTSPKPEDKKKQEKTWIEILLLDTDDNPIANERYAIELPDGKVKEGKLNGKGRARVEGIDPGSATVKFPDIEKDSGKGGAGK